MAIALTLPSTSSCFLDVSRSQVIQEAAAHGTKGLHHVDAPKEGIHPLVRDAYLAEHGGASGGLGQQRGNCNKCQGSCKC